MRRPTPVSPEVPLQSTLRDYWDEVANVAAAIDLACLERVALIDRKSTRLNSSHANISYAVFCLKKNTFTHALHPQHLVETFTMTISTITYITPHMLHILIVIKFPMFCIMTLAAYLPL